MERVREILQALPLPPPPALDEPLLRDYHRMVEIHQLAGSDGGVAGARARVQLTLSESAAAVAAAPGLAARRMETIREEMRASAQEELRRLEAISADEESAVLACRGEIEAAMARLAAG